MNPFGVGHIPADFINSLSFQLQVGLQSNVAQPHDLFDEDDDVDAALTDLQISLEGAAVNGRSHHQVPHLADSLRYFRPRRCVVG